MLPLAAILAGALISSSGANAGAPAIYTPVSPTSTGTAAATTPPAPVARGASPASAAPPGNGAIVASLRHPTTLLKAPGGAVLHPLSLRTQFGSPEVLWVVRSTPRWLGVITNLAGNGAVGWIPRDAAQLSRVDWKIEVSLSGRRVTVIHAGKVLKRYTVAVGQPAAPTPTGRFAVTDRLATNNPTGPYGCCIIALSALAPHAIQNWSGGNRIAIHSTPETASIGQPVSHGCLRLTLAEGRWLMNHIPLGTPTLING